MNSESSLTTHWPAFQRDLSLLDPLLAEMLNTNSLWQTQIESLYTLLLSGNQRMNLTRVTDPKGFLERHILDSLSLSTAIPAHANVLDIGSGAGFPAFPLLLARPDITLTALETVGKKCTFLQETAEALALGSRFTVIQGRTEDLGHDPQHRERYTIVTARAVAALPILLEWGLPFLEVKGTLLALKGRPTLDSERKESTRALKTLHGSLQPVLLPEPPCLNHSVVIPVTKMQSTPKQFPRKPGIPTKQPL